MKRLLLGLLIVSALLYLSLHFIPESEISTPIKFRHEKKFSTINGIVQPNETMDFIFTKYNLSKKELSDILISSRSSYDLSRLSVGSMYILTIDEKDKMVHNLRYGIDSTSYLNVAKRSNGFISEKVTIPQETKTGSVYITIQDNLVMSMPSNHPEYLKLALELSDIYAWDIDFSSDIRNGDTLKIIVEELWSGAAFNGFRNILAAEFLNNGKTYTAYRFTNDSYTDYYDTSGKSLKKVLLRSPLKFRYISSHFSRSRFHPILRIYRPHLGVDYAAPSGTPVSASGNGTVIFAGYGGGIGNVVKIKHPGGFETSYGHLSKIQRGVRRGAKIAQGDTIGYVGSTGLSTGPHLDYRMKQNGRFVNPLKIELPRGEPVPQHVMAEFRNVVNRLSLVIFSITKPVIAFSDMKDREG